MDPSARTSLHCKQRWAAVDDTASKAETKVYRSNQTNKLPGDFWTISGRCFKETATTILLVSSTECKVCISWQISKTNKHTLSVTSCSQTRGSAEMRYVPAWPLESRSVLPVERRHQRLSWQTADCPAELVQPRSHAASASNTHNLSVTHQYNYTSVDFSYDSMPFFFTFLLQFNTKH